MGGESIPEERESIHFSGVVFSYSRMCRTFMNIFMTLFLSKHQRGPVQIVGKVGQSVLT